MELAIETATNAGALTREHLLQTHAVLFVSAVGVRQRAGELRDVQNWIGGNDYNPCGAGFVPQPVDEVPRLLDDLVAFCNDDSLPPLVQAAYAHAQFETIHPIVDGNGRTGRALIQMILRRRGLASDPPISVVLAADKGRCISVLAAF